MIIIIIPTRSTVGFLVLDINELSDPSSRTKSNRSHPIGRLGTRVTESAEKEVHQPLTQLQQLRDALRRTSTSHAPALFTNPKNIQKIYFSLLYFRRNYILCIFLL
jgi:hypothetical protein